MLTILSIISFIIAIVIASYHLHKTTKEKYGYLIFSIGGMGVSFIGSVAFVFAHNYYCQNLLLNMVIAILFGVSPYILMFIRDLRKTTIIIAIAALILRFTISALLIAAIIWYFYMKRSSMDELKAQLKAGKIL